MLTWIIVLVSSSRLTQQPQRDDFQAPRRMCNVHTAGRFYIGESITILGDNNA